MALTSRIVVGTMAFVAAGATVAHVLSPADPEFRAVGQAVPSESTSGTVVWQDDFVGARGDSPDPAKWNHAVGGRGWGNEEEQCYTDEASNSALDGKGHLVITARPEPDGIECAGGTRNAVSSARLNTRGLFDFRYGTVEVRAKVPSAPGTWPALWALPSDDDVSWPDGGEFDVLEHIGRRPHELHSTVHGANAQGGHEMLSVKTTLDEPVSQEWHVYSVTWEKDVFTYRLDGDVIARITRDQASEKSMSWPFDEEFHLVLNLAFGGTWAGTEASLSRPQQFLVDWVRVRSL